MHTGSFWIKYIKNKMHSGLYFERSSTLVNLAFFTDNLMDFWKWNIIFLGYIQSEIAQNGLIQT